MGIGNLITFIYLLIGMVLTTIWWEKEYKAEYEYEKSKGTEDEGAVLFVLSCLVIFWPLKLLTYIDI